MCSQADAAHPLQALKQRLRQVGGLGRARQQRGRQLARVAHQGRSPARRQQLQRDQRGRLQRLRRLRGQCTASVERLSELPARRQQLQRHQRGRLQAACAACTDSRLPH